MTDYDRRSTVYSDRDGTGHYRIVGVCPSCRSLMDAQYSVPEAVPYPDPLRLYMGETLLDTFAAVWRTHIEGHREGQVAP